MVGQKLAGRYRLLKQLGQGGFGQAYLAEDEHLPDEYQCVVKRFHMGETQQEDTLQTAKRLFDSEAKALHRLGHHEQLPKLLAHFEDDGEFYLVEEYIPGPGLDTELQPGIAMPEVEVIQLLHDLLSVLSFVHQKHVIHRDIKPSNIIRRDSDQRLVLIDFGAVKHVTTQMIGGTVRPHTVVIGTPGYMPSEQFRGSPKPSSDVYAVGMIGIQAITGLNPSMGELPEDDTTGEIQWQEQADVSPELAEVLSKMVRYDFRQRYRSATEALEALNDLTSPSASSETEVATAEETPPTEVSIPMPEDVANLPETQVQPLNNGNITPEGSQESSVIPMFVESKAAEELPPTTVQQTTNDSPTTRPQKSEASKSFNKAPSKFGHKSWKWLAGGGLAIAASGLFALVGAPHIEGICAALGNCTAAVKARSDLASALSTLETSDEKLAKATSIPDLESLQTEMKAALETVQSIGSDNRLAIAEEAKTSADDYGQKLTQLTQRIKQEKESQKNLDSAVAKASEAFKEKESAKTIAAMDENINKWQAAVDFLKKIKEPTFVYDQAQTKKKDYEGHIKNLNASIDKIVAEDRARQQQQAAARQAEQQRSAQTPAYSPAPSYASNSGGGGSSYQEPAPVYQEPAYQAPAPTYQEPAYQAPAPAPPPSNSEPLWGGPSDPQAEPLW